MNLPLEIALLVAESAAWEESWNNEWWVAELTLVCRAFKTAIDPILYHCIFVDKNNWKRLYQAVSACCSGFAHTRRVMMVAHLYAINQPANAALAKAFAHVQFVAGQVAGVMSLLRENPAPRPTAVSITNMPDDMWFRQPRASLRHCTHLHTFFDTSTWGRRGRPRPVMLLELERLTHLALDIADDDESPADIYDAFAPCLPLTVQRILFRTRWLGYSPVFSMQLAQVAAARRDTRVWLEDSALNPTHTALQADLDDIRLGLDLWELGHQLYPAPGQ